MSGDGDSTEVQLSAFIATAESEFKRLNSLIKDLSAKLDDVTDKLVLEKAERSASEKRLAEVEQQSSHFEKLAAELQLRLAKAEKRLDSEVDICVNDQKVATVNKIEIPLPNLDATAGHEHLKSTATKINGTAATDLDKSSVYDEVERLRRKTGRSRALPHSPVRSRRSSASLETQREVVSHRTDEDQRSEMKKFKFKIPKQFKSCDGSDPSEFLDWLTKIERVASASDWNSSYKCWLVANLVEGHAAHILDCCEDAVKKDWKELKKKLFKKLVPAQHFEHLRNNLRRVHQKSIDDVDGYITEFREKARKAYANNRTGKYEEDIVHMFIDGLNSEDLRLKALEQHCESLDEVAEYILNCVALQELAKQSPSSMTSTSAFAESDCTPLTAKRSRQTVNRRFEYGRHGRMRINCPRPMSWIDSGEKDHERFQGQCFEFDKSRQCRDFHQTDSGCETVSATTYDDCSHSNSTERHGPACYVTVGPFNHQPDFDLQALIPCQLGTNGSPATALVDNGSSCNILKEACYMQCLIKAPIQKSGVKTINSLSGHAMNVIGKVKLSVGIGQPSVCEFNTVFYVVPELPFDMIIGAEGMYDGYLRTNIRSKTVCAHVGQREVSVPFLSTSVRNVPSRVYEPCSNPRVDLFNGSTNMSCKDPWYCPLENELIVIDDKKHIVSCARVLSAENWGIRSQNVVIVENMGSKRPFAVHRRFILPLKRNIKLLPRETRRQEALYRYVLSRYS